MYHLVYVLLYLLSLLPLRLLYLLSDLIFLIMYHVARYRRAVVASNLLIAFPNKTIAERNKIEKRFYALFADSFIETIKLISITKAELERRITGNFQLINDLYPSYPKVQIHSGHFFNWEFMNLACGSRLEHPFLGIYMPLSNNIMDRIMKKMRSRFGTILIAAPEFRTSFHQYSQKEYAIGLIADQSTANYNSARWHRFFGKPAPFVTGPEKGALRNNTAVVMVKFYRKKRGYYHADFSLLTAQPRETSDGFITKALITFIEQAVKEHPENYLWTHRRWKHEFNAEVHQLLD